MKTRRRRGRRWRWRWSVVVFVVEEEKETGELRAFYLCAKTEVDTMSTRKWVWKVMEGYSSDQCSLNCCMHQKFAAPSLAQDGIASY